MIKKNHFGLHGECASLIVFSNNLSRLLTRGSHGMNGPCEKTIFYFPF